MEVKKPPFFYFVLYLLNGFQRYHRTEVSTQKDLRDDRDTDLKLVPLCRVHYSIRVNSEYNDIVVNL